MKFRTKRIIKETAFDLLVFIITTAAGMGGFVFIDIALPVDWNFWETFSLAFGSMIVIRAALIAQRVMDMR